VKVKKLKEWLNDKNDEDIVLVKDAYWNANYFEIDAKLLSTKECPKKLSIAESIDKHRCCRNHCCIKHGCKYNHRDCPVETGKIKQSGDCEHCGLEKEGYYGEINLGKSWQQIWEKNERKRIKRMAKR
jgi:hypothetical protein